MATACLPIRFLFLITASSLHHTAMLSNNAKEAHASASNADVEMRMGVPPLSMQHGIG